MGPMNEPTKIEYQFQLKYRTMPLVSAPTRSNKIRLQELLKVTVTNSEHNS